MPRSHARIGVAIWSDPDWLDLPMHAQWLYMALLSQAEINHAGVVSLTTKRWAKLCSNRDPDLIADALKVLAERRFVVVDDDDEQLLVRSFIRGDKVASQPNTLKNACESAQLVTSRMIRGALLVELRRLDQARISAMRTAEGHEPAIAVLRRTITALSGASKPPPDAPPVTPSDGYGDPIGYAIGDPSPRTRAGDGDGEGGVVKSPNSSSGRTPAATRARARDHPTIAELAGTAHSGGAHKLVERYAATCRRRPPAKILSQLAVEVDALLAEGWPDDEISAALDAWGSKGLGPGAFQAVAHEVANRRPAPTRSERQFAALQALKQPEDQPPPFPALRAIEGGTG